MAEAKRKTTTVLKRGIAFDMESFRAVEATARREKTSFSNAVRMLVRAGARRKAA